jgi:NADPH:quinone reductase-like Zn-dependent oxidoreductase
VRGAGIDRFGDPVRVLPRPDPRALRDDEVLIRVRVAGMGNWDDIVRTGGWATGAAPPCALGVEAAGVITAAGARVSGLQPGDGVLTHPLPLRQDGAWTEQLIAPAALVAGKPAGVPWPEAAALPVPGITALQALTGSAQLAAGETVLANGAGGVTGGLLVQLAALAGARVIATASPASAPRLRRAGADLVLDYHQPDWPDRAQQAAGGPLPAAVNAVPGGAARLLPLIADGGRLTTLTSDPPDPARQVRIDSLYVQPDAGQLGYLAQLLDRGAITLAVRASFPLDSAAEALAQARRGGGGAAVVLEPAG